MPAQTEILGFIAGVAGWHEKISVQYFEDSLSVEEYAEEVSRMLERVLRYARLNSSSSQQDVLEFWNHHRNFAEWNFVTPREDGYEFLSLFEI